MFGRRWRTLWRLEEGDATVLNCRTLRYALVRPLHELCGLFCFAAALILHFTGTVKAAEAVDVPMGFLSYRSPSPSYGFNPVPEGEGFAGGSLAIRDNNTTGAMIGQRYRLDEAWLDENENPGAKALTFVQDDVRFPVVKLPVSEPLAIAFALEDRSVVPLGMGTQDNRLRGADSVIDTKTPMIVKIGLKMPGLPKEAIEPAGGRLILDDSRVFVALGPAKTVGVVNTDMPEVDKCLLVGQRVWQLALTPDEKLLFATNGNPVDVGSLKVVERISVGRVPWGVAVAPE
ncbi:hypothetical protein [Microvirga makkahensis]|uniref:Uncharacterized protein n=1 Tax=Microvirga makkahensis TaxID=1128670 RepID=A0A7X3SPA5_9HYPH|nr:hypothetical protein [Microvirga makkahensis]MXQ12065.1 hypothetical protein [Microvirga makkahensis]